MNEKEKKLYRSLISIIKTNPLIDICRIVQEELDERQNLPDLPDMPDDDEIPF